MRSLLKLTRPAGTVALVALAFASGCSVASAEAATQATPGQLDDLPMVAISAELAECLPGVGNVIDPFWTPDAQDASVNGYGYIDSRLNPDLGLHGGESIDCEAVSERATAVAIANAQISTGSVFSETDKAWASCMESKGFPEADSLINRQRTLEAKMAIGEGVMTEAAYRDLLEPIRGFEVSMAMADSDCFAAEVLTRTESLAAEQESMLADLPADQLELLRGA